MEACRGPPEVCETLTMTWEKCAKCPSHPEMAFTLLVQSLVSLLQPRSSPASLTVAAPWPLQNRGRLLIFDIPHDPIEAVDQWELKGLL